MLDSEPPGIFDRAVVDAAKEMKFAKRRNVTRIARNWTLSLNAASRRPDPMEVSCLKIDNVPERFLKPGPAQPEPPDEW